MTNICLKCAHDINIHRIQIIGNYDFIQVSCQYSGEDGYTIDAEICDCDAGFKKVSIKKEFNQMD